MFDKILKTLMLLTVAALPQACSSSLSESHARTGHISAQVSMQHTLTVPASASIDIAALDEAELADAPEQEETDSPQPYAAIEKTEAFAVEAPMALSVTEEESEEVADDSEETVIDVSAVQQPVKVEEISVSVSTEAPKNAEIDVAFSAEVSEVELDRTRGAFLPEVFNVGQLKAISEGNSVEGGITGTNLIDSNAFSNSGGLVSVIQNSGNNVIIQSNTIVNLNFDTPVIP